MGNQREREIMKTSKSEILEMLYQLAEQIVQYENDGIDIIGIEMASDLGISINGKLNNQPLNVIFIENDKIMQKKMN